MANGDSKTPTWQWIAGIAMSGLMFFSSVMLMTALSDIKEGRKITTEINLRVTSIEKTMPLQFEAIREWREEIRESLAQIASNQKYIATRQTNKSNIIIEGQKSAAKTKAKGVVIFGK
jgi:hypothetical protein